MSADPEPTPENSQSPNHQLSPFDPPTDGHGAGDGRAPSASGAGLPTKNSLLEKLNCLGGLVAIGVLHPTKANSMRGIYGTMLSHLDEAAPPGAGTLADQDVLRILRESPATLTLIKPFLSQEQVALVIREAPP